MSDLSDRADIILKVLGAQGGTASTRRIWLTVNENNKMSMLLVRRILGWMERQGAVRGNSREYPLIWTLTDKGRERLRRIALPVHQMPAGSRVLGEQEGQCRTQAVVPEMHLQAPET